MSRAMRHRVALVAAGLLGAAAWWLWPEGRDADATAHVASVAPDTAVPAAPPDATRETTRPATTAGAPPGALPAESLPLARRVAELQRWADAGHPEARCRLAIERLRCRALDVRTPAIEPTDYERQLERAGNLEAANALAEAALRRVEQARECRDLPAFDRADALTLLAPAAAAGHAPSQVLYFTVGNSLRFRRGIYQHPGFDAWRSQAAQYLAAAARAGDPEAVATLAQALGSDRDMADGLVPDDPRAAYRQRALADALFGRTTHPSWARHAGLDEAERVRLEAEARQLHTQRFGGRRFRDRRLDAQAPHAHPDLSASDFCGPPLAL